jgi:hypothetical protein
MTKKIFAIRLTLYIILGLILPIGFLAWRFELFSKVTKISFSVWGLIAIITTIVFVLGLFNGLRKGMKFGLAKQVTDTICKVTIPLVIVTVAFDWMSSFSKEFVQFLIVLVICETAAGSVNPIPQWCFENNIEQTGNIFKKMFDWFK